MIPRLIQLPILVLFFTLMASVVAIGQKGSIKGIIKDATSGDALIGAFAIIEGSSIGTATDIDGKFILPNVPAGEHLLKITYIGYEDKIESVVVVEGEVTKVDVKLGFEGIALGAVEVTAQAKGQMSAINDQLNSKSIVNVVSAERIQELPDANAAETIGRISGVSVLRTGGEGNKVVIRGLSPKYSKVMFEGVAMSGGEGDRSTDISMISPYSLDGIEVMKSVTADQDADFIGGSVNFKLRVAPKDWHYDLVAQIAHNGLKSTNSDYMIVGNVSNRFFDNKFGIYLQGNIEKRNRSSNSLLANYNVRNSAEIGKNNPVYIQSLRLTDAIREKSRTGATLVFDYKLKDGVIHFKNIYNSGKTDVDKYNQTFDINSRKHIYESRAEQYNLNTTSSILDFEKRFGLFKIDGKVAYSFTNNKQPSTLSFVFEQDGALASAVKDDAIAPNQVAGFANIDDSKTFFNRYNEGTFVTEEQQMSSSFNIQYDFSINKQINGNFKTGFKYRTKDRFHDRDIYGGDLKIGSGQSANDAILRAFPWMQETVEIGNRLPYTLFNNDNFDHKDFLAGEYSVGSVARLDLMQEVLDALKNAEGLSMDGYFNLERSSNTYDYSGNEYLTAGYLMAEINIGKKVKFIPGVRYEQNKTIYTGTQGITNIAFAERNYILKDTTVTRTNAFLLPMIHLKYSPFEWFNIRMAFTQTLSRPSYNQITPRRDLWANTVSWNNYGLEPEFANNFDLYLSFHENHIGLFTIGGFTKKIENMIFNLGKRVIIDPEEYDLSEENRFRNIYTVKNNEYTATVSGLEADWQMNFWFLPGALQGIVFNVNYTHIFSEAKYPRTEIKNLAELPWDPPIWANIDTFYTSQLINQPDDIVNVQLGYDYKGFSARFSMLYQSSTFKRPQFWPELSQFSDNYLRWDFSVKQKLPWANLQVFCNINNISGAKDRDLVKGARWDASIQDYGATIDIGVRMKL